MSAPDEIWEIFGELTPLAEIFRETGGDLQRVLASVADNEDAAVELWRGTLGLPADPRPLFGWAVSYINEGLADREPYVRAYATLLWGFLAGRAYEHQVIENS